MVARNEALASAVVTARNFCRALRYFWAAFLFLPLFAFATTDASASTKIVALGASNVEGWRISGAAFPELLQSALRRRGQDVTVVNEGRAWDSSGKMLARLDAAVPSDTSIVILAENVRQGSNGQIGAIENRLRSRGIKIIRVNFRNIPSNLFQQDGIHLTEAGQQFIASRLVPQVMSAIKGTH